MKKILCLSICYFLFLIVTSQIASAQQDYNLGFENTETFNHFPKRWSKLDAGYKIFVDSLEKKEGKNSICISSEVEIKGDSNGYVFMEIPANYEGKFIELSGFIKMENVKDHIGLILNLFENSRMLEEFDMKKKKIHGSSGWVEYSAKVPYHKSVQKIQIGAYMSKSGKIWIDDFKLQIDGVDISNVKEKVSKISLDHEFDTGSKIDIKQVNAEEIKNLKLLGIIWGFLKYYHPEVGNGIINWDYELFRILPKILISKTKKERDNILLDWVENLGVIVKSKNNNASGLSKKVPHNQCDFSWLDDQTISPDLTYLLKNIIEAKRSSTNYYVQSFPAGNADFKNELSYKDMKFPDTGFRLLALFRYWNIIHYYFPYKHLFDEDWKLCLDEFIPRYIYLINELEYKLTTTELIGKIHDTHANLIAYDDETINQFLGKKVVPVELKFIKEQPVVIKTFIPVTSPQLKVGDVITKVNNVSIVQMVTEKLKYNPASNYSTQLRNISNDLLRTNDSTLKIEYQREGQMFTTEFSVMNYESFIELMSKLPKDTCLKMLESDIAYLNLDNINEKDLPDHMKQILPTKGLIIDIRNYPSAFLIFELNKYLMPQVTPVAKWSQVDFVNPGNFYIKYTTEAGSKNEDYYKGKVILLINEQTQSMAEYTAMALRASPNAKIIGSTTAGADGNVSKIVLPGNLRTYISGIGVYYPDGKETQRVGIIPDIFLEPSIEGISANRDELIEKAIEVIHSN